MARGQFEQRYGQLFHHPELKAHIHWPRTEEAHYIDAPDGHLNDRGHRTYADLLLRVLNHR